MSKIKLKRKPKIIRKKMPLWGNTYFRLTIFCLLFLFEVFYLFIFSPLFQIREIIITAPIQIPDNILRDLAKQTAIKKVLFWRTESIFLYNSRRVRETILQRFSQIESVRIKRTLPGTLFVAVKNRQAVLQWCLKEQCLFVTGNGLLFYEEFSVQKAPDFLIFSDKEDIIKPGEKVLDREKIEQIFEISKTLNEELKIEAKNFIIGSVKFAAKTARGAEIYFDLESDVSKQLFNLRALLEKEIIWQEYIDLRFGNKVYYQ